LECEKREAEDIGGIVRIAGERNSVKGKELRLLWLKIEGFGERIEEAVEGEGGGGEKGGGEVSGEDEREEERKKKKKKKEKK
jgi:hypothetical protein